VLYAISSFKRKLTLPDGKTIKREFKAGEVMWLDVQAHIDENVGQFETHVIIVALKAAPRDTVESRK
jgi:hypothetical protein